MRGHVLRRIFSTDHKVIGLQYGFTSLFFLLVGFALVILIRWQHAFTGQPLPFIVVNPDNPLGLDRNEPVGKDAIIATNRMNLPVGKPVVIFLSSKDVIHSFGLPQMRVKQDAIPGIVQPVWFTPTQLGQWDIACSQLCGLGHFRMKGVYAIQTQEAFDAWLSDEAEFLTNP
jgi:heme/copper-type cytochrome/quinol oxidase subunit 2